MSDFDANTNMAISELLKEGKIRLIEDIYSYAGIDTKTKSPPTPPTPKKPPKTLPPVKEPPIIPPVDVDDKLNKDMINILINDGNLVNLGIFLGYKLENVLNILYKKNKYTIKNLPPGAVAAVDMDNNVLISRDAFNFILKYYTSSTKPARYWYYIYVFIHEIIHVFTRTKEPIEIAIALDEAITPIIEHEFLVNYNGATSPHLIDLSETNFDRMSHKKAGLSPLQYPKHTFFFFDQLVGFDSIFPDYFLKVMRQYAHVGDTYKNKKALIEKYYPLEEK